MMTQAGFENVDVTPLPPDRNATSAEEAYVGFTRPAAVASSTVNARISSSDSISL